MSFRFGRYFSISSLVGVVIVIAVLSFFYRYTAVNILIENETRANTALARVLANIVLNKHSQLMLLSPGYLAKNELVAKQEVARLQQDMLQLVSEANIANMKIINLNGDAIFTTQSESLGKNFSRNTGFQHARSGNIFSDLAYNNRSQEKDSVLWNHDLLSTYIPLRYPDSDEIRGVFELNMDVTDLVDNIRRTQENVIGGVFVSLMLLYLFLQVIVKRADKVIKEHEKAWDSSIEQIRYLASHDQLTQLPNKQQFTRCLNAALKNAREKQQMLALVFIDVDRFKLVNDSLGHGAGDELLRIVAKRLQYPIRQCDQLFRWGGDEFTVVLDNISDIRLVESMAKRIVASLAKPINLKDQEVLVTTSIGIAIYNGEYDTTVSQLIDDADTAMYQAKRAGRNRYRFFDPQYSLSVGNLTSIDSLKHALENNEFRLYYQPRLSVFSGKVTAVEAFLHWEHPQHGLLTPDKFVPLLEDSGMMALVGEWILNTVCQQIQKWKSAGMPAIRVSINLSANQLMIGNVAEQISQAINNAGIEGHSLELEISEPTVIDNKEFVRAIMDKLKTVGVTLSIDGFGFAYWSLKHLKLLPVDYIKISPEIVSAIDKNTQDLISVRAISRLAHNMNLRLVAEGVESKAQFDILKKTGCHELQGDALGKPVLPDKIPAFVESQSKPQARLLALPVQV